jgi:hypothetical protein
MAGAGRLRHAHVNLRPRRCSRSGQSGGQAARERRHGTGRRRRDSPEERGQKMATLG